MQHSHKSPRYYCRSWTFAVSGNVVFGTVSQRRPTRASYDCALPHTFVISRAHAHEYMASISSGIYDTAGARTCVWCTDLGKSRNSQQRASSSSSSPPRSLVRRVGGEAPAARASHWTYLSTPLLVFMLTGRLYWLWINRARDCRPDSRACLDGRAYTCAKHARERGVRTAVGEEKRREEKSITGG